MDTPKKWHLSSARFYLRLASHILTYDIGGLNSVEIDRLRHRRLRSEECVFCDECVHLAPRSFVRSPLVFPRSFLLLSVEDSSFDSDTSDPRGDRPSFLFSQSVCLKLRVSVTWFVSFVVCSTDVPM